MPLKTDNVKSYDNRILLTFGGSLILLILAIINLLYIEEQFGVYKDTSNKNSLKFSLR